MHLLTLYSTEMTDPCGLLDLHVILVHLISLQGRGVAHNRVQPTMDRTSGVARNGPTCPTRQTVANLNT